LKDIDETRKVLRVSESHIQRKIGKEKKSSESKITSKESSK